MDDCLIIVKQTVLNIIQTIRIFCCGVNLQDKDGTWERSWATGRPSPSPSTTSPAAESLSTKEHLLPGSSATLKTASVLPLLSGHFCKNSQQLHSWKSCSLPCWAPGGPLGVSETHRTCQPVRTKYETKQITTGGRRECFLRMTGGKKHSCFYWTTMIKDALHHLEVCHIHLTLSGLS